MLVHMFKYVHVHMHIYIIIAVKKLPDMSGAR